MDIYSKTRQMEIERRFLNHINDNYSRLVSTALLMFNNSKKKIEFSEDIFNDTIIKCYELLEKKKSMKDESPKGMDNYFLKSLYLNTMMEKRYAYVKKRSHDIDVNSVLSSRDNGDSQVQSKLVKDLKTDFSVLYIMMQVEEHFDQQHFYLYRLKALCEMTYKDICNKTQIKGARNMIIEVRTWIQNNIKKEDIDKAFYETYGDLI
jgi:hypothetical protein